MWEAWAIRDPSPEPECNAKKDCPQAFHAPRAAANAKQPDAQKTKKTGTLSEFIFGSGRNGPGAALKMQHPHEPSTTRPRCDSTRILTTSRFSCLKHALGQPGSFFDEVAFSALQPAQPDDFRRRVHLPARLPVGEQMGQDEGVPPVVLSSGRGEPDHVSKALQKAFARNWSWRCFGFGSTIPRTGKDDTMTGMRGRSKRAEFKTELEARLPAAVRGPGRELPERIGNLTAKIGKLDKEARKRAKESDEARRMTAIPETGPVCAMAIQVFAPPMEGYRHGRDFSAWSRQCST